MAVLNIAAIKFLFSGGGVYFQNWCRIKSHLRVNVFQTNINTPKLQILPACQRDKPPFLEVWNTTRFRKRENFEFLLVTTLYDLFVFELTWRVSRKVLTQLSRKDRKVTRPQGIFQWEQSRFLSNQCFKTSVFGLTMTSGGPSRTPQLLACNITGLLFFC